MNSTGDGRWLLPRTILGPNLIRTAAEPRKAKQSHQDDWGAHASIAIYVGASAYVDDRRI
jgi:hypothetical protein